MFSSLATCSASIPKISTTEAVTWVDFNALGRDGNERVMVIASWTPSGKLSRPSKFIGGRKTLSMLTGWASRTSFMALDGDPNTGMIHVMWKLWWRMSSLANSTKGMRSPFTRLIIFSLLLTAYHIYNCSNIIWRFTLHWLYVFSVYYL